MANGTEHAPERATASITKLGGRAWVVIVAFFFLSLIEMGVIKSFGVLVDDITLQLDKDPGMIGLSIGLYHGIAYALAPFIAPLAKKKSLSRPIMLCGSFVMGVGLSTASVSSSFAGFTIALLIAGVGFSVVSMLSVVAFSQHFDKHFALAFGISDMGSALSMVLPLVTEVLLEAYGWRGAILLLGGIALNTVMLCALLRHPETIQKFRRAATALYAPIGDKCEVVTANYLEAPLRKENVLHSSTIGVGSVNVEYLDIQRRFASWPNLLLARDVNDLSGGGSVANVACLQFRQPKEEKDDPPRGTESEGDGKTQERPTINDDYTEAPSVVHGSRSDSTRRKLFCTFLRPLRWLWSSLDLSLCRDEPYMNFIFLITFLYGMISTAWYIFLLPHTVAKDIDLSRAVLLSLFAGSGDTIGRFGQGPLVHRGFVTSIGLFMILALLNSVVLFVDPLLASFEVLAVAAFMNGIFFGMQTVLTMIMLKDNIHPSRFPTVYGLSCLAYGCSEPVGGFAAGYIASKFGYDITFVFLGGLSVATSLLLAPSYWHYCRRRKNDQGTSETTS
ncbi:monocarboxylate transporter 7-like [Diadema antillarum]|uniref:monocarboxylate transporter 7-like n=1 Tax=Diadema antillarum TaxID=105358 RepID=UPI003A8BB5EF